jgi:hypothetical protein
MKHSYSGLFQLSFRIEAAAMIGQRSCIPSFRKAIHFSSLAEKFAVWFSL